jgi:hypothetical protein
MTGISAAPAACRQVRRPVRATWYLALGAHHRRPGRRVTVADLLTALLPSRRLPRRRPRHTRRACGVHGA